MSTSLRNLALAPGLLLLGACTVGPDYAGPPPIASSAMQDGFVRSGPSATAEKPALAPWWESLGDPVLNQLEERALNGNPDLAIAQARVAEALAALGETRADRGPSVSAMAVAAHLRVPGIDLNDGSDEDGSDSSGSSGSSTNFYNLGLNASWEIDLFGGHERQLEAARSEIDAAGADLADAQVSLTSAIAQAYLNLRERRERIALAEQAVTRREQMLDLQRQRFDQGVISQIPVEQAEASLATARAQAGPLRADAAGFANALAILTGEAPGAVDDLIAGDRPAPLPPSSVAVGDPAALIARRPDIRAAERKLAAANARIGVATAAGLPRLNFMGLLGIGGTNISDLTKLDDFTAIAAPMLQWNFLDFGRNKARVGQAEARRDAADAQYRKTVLGALRDVEDALATFRYSRETAASLARAEKNAANLEQHARQRYSAGSGSLRDLLDAELNHDKASGDLATARTALTQAFISLEKALGLGWQVPPT